MTHIVFPGDDVDECASLRDGARALSVVENSSPEHALLRTYYVDDQDMDGIGSGGSAACQGGSCVASRSAGDSVGSACDNGDVCTWSTIGGCTEEGKKFIDYAVCTLGANAAAFCSCAAFIVQDGRG